MSSTLLVRDRESIVRKGRWLQYLTIAWNCVECVIALGAGYLSGSIALIGFGVDSAIEVTSSGAALWRLRQDCDQHSREAAERLATRLIGLCFFVLAIYVLYQALLQLVHQLPPEESPVGIVLAALSLMVMPVLAYLKRGVARSLESGALSAESRQTEICAYLSAILLGGLGLHTGLGWWWADPVAGLVMVPFIAREGWQAIQGRACCGH